MSRHAVPIPAANADLATTWAYLEDGVDHIMTKLQSGVSFSKVNDIFQRLQRPNPLTCT